jgi:hypothetical protein
MPRVFRTSCETEARAFATLLVRYALYVRIYQEAAYVSCAGKNSADRFAALVRLPQPKYPASWVKLAQRSGVPERASFARGVLRYWAAAPTGLEGSWRLDLLCPHVLDAYWPRLHRTCR